MANVHVKCLALKTASASVRQKPQDDPRAFAKALIQEIKVLRSSVDTHLATGASQLLTKLGID